MKFDNHDERIPYFELLMKRPDLENIPTFSLPDGFRLVMYHEGDKKSWIEIETSAKEFKDEKTGEKAWETYYRDHEEVLHNRMFFVEDSMGKKVATATAFFDPKTCEGSQDGWVHWVSVRRDYQNLGISKPLLSETLLQMKKLGYGRAFVASQTTTWLACRIYLDLGFLPVMENEFENLMGWRILKTLTNHPTLDYLEPVTEKELLIK